MSFIKPISITAIILALLAAGAYWYMERGEEPVTVDVEEVTYQEVSDQGSESRDQEEVVPNESEESPEPVEENPGEEDEVIDTSEEPVDGIPAQFNLAVPFTSQAPHANWELPYQEACEEASAYMVAKYFEGAPSGKINPDQADADLLESIAFEDDFLGFHLDTTVDETVRFIDAFYGLNARAIENPTVADIKAEIAAGRPVIVPAAGRELGNPNFTGAGPLYHMFVIKGYTATQFITNDPGTRNGENFVYNIDVIMSAMGDWNDGDPANGAKRVIFVSP